MSVRALTLLLALALIAPAARFAAASDAALRGLYAQGEFDAATARCDSLLRVTPEDAELNQLMGRILADTRRCREAIPFLSRAAAVDTAAGWIRAWSQVYLGVCHYDAGDRDAAGRAWVAARDMAATRNSTAIARLYLISLIDNQPFAAWTARDTQHFEFRFSPQLSAFDYDTFAREHEEALTQIAAWFGHEPPHKIRFYVWSSNDEARQAGLPNLGFSRPAVSLVHAAANQTIGHEMSHVIAFQAIPPRGAVGLISEGAAVFHDQRSADRLTLARKAWSAVPADKRPGLLALWGDWRLLDDATSYPVAGAFVARLVERGGRERFLELYGDQSVESARRIYGAEFDGWVKEFEQQLGDGQ